MKSWKFGYCSTFVFIWQLVFNHGLIRLKTVRLVISNQTVQLVFFHLHLMLHARIARFDVMATAALFRKKVFGTKRALSTSKLLRACLVREIFWL